MKHLKLFIKIFFLMLCAFLIHDITNAEAAKLNKTEKQIKKDVVKYSVTVDFKEAESQRFKINDNEITKLEIKSIKYNKKKTTATAKVSLSIDRDVAAVKGDVSLVYTYSAKKRNWKLKSVVYNKTYLSVANLMGIWEGTYVAEQGETKIQIEIPEITEDGFLSNAKLSFSALPTNPTVPSGSYYVIGGSDLKTGKVNFTGDTWIVKPDDTWHMINFNAYFDLVNKRLTGTNNSLILVKQN